MDSNKINEEGVQDFMKLGVMNYCLEKLLHVTTLLNFVTNPNKNNNDDSVHA